MSIRDALHTIEVDDSLIDHEYLDEQESLEKRTNRRWYFAFTEKELLQILSLRQKWMIWDHRKPFLDSKWELKIHSKEWAHMSVYMDGNVKDHQRLQSQEIWYYGYANVITWYHTEEEHKLLTILWDTHDSGEARTRKWDILIMKKEEDEEKLDKMDEYLEWIMVHLNSLKSRTELDANQNDKAYDIEKALLQIYEINENKKHPLYASFSMYEKISYLVWWVYALKQSNHLNDLNALLTVLLKRQMKNFEQYISSLNYGVLLFLDDYRLEIENMFQYVLKSNLDNDFIKAYKKRGEYESILDQHTNQISEIRSKVVDHFEWE